MEGRELEVEENEGVEVAVAMKVDADEEGMANEDNMKEGGGHQDVVELVLAGVEPPRRPLVHEHLQRHVRLLPRHDEPGARLRLGGKDFYNIS